MYHIRDYFESEIFFKPFSEQIRKMYQASSYISENERLREKINFINSKESSVAVHIRRTDFVDRIRFLPLSYQIRGMDLIA